MLSRMTNAVLLLAVIVLSAALLRSMPCDQHAPAPLVAETTASQIGIGSETEMYAAAFGQIDGLEGLLAIVTQDSPQTDESATGNRRHPGNGRPMENRNGDAPSGGAGGARHGGPGNWPHSPRLTPQLVARSIEVAREVDQELGEKLARAKEQNPQEFERLMRQGGIGRRLLSMAQLKDREPELYRAKHAELSQALQIERVAGQLREAAASGSQGEIDSLESQLRSLLQVQLVMSIKSRGDLLCKLEDRMNELRDELTRDATNFQAIIDARMKALAKAPAVDQKPLPEAASTR